MSGDRGAVTVEAAVATCVLLVVLAAAASGIAVVMAQVRCTDAAREAARLVARGEQDRAHEAAQKIAPRSTLNVQLLGDATRVEVREASPLPGVEVRAEAFAVLEPT